MQTSNVKTFDGHFLGMGPYGDIGNQDHAFGVPFSKDNNGILYVEFDISSQSIQYINDHYISGKGDSPEYAIYDYETDAFPSGNFTKAFYEIKTQKYVPSITTLMTKMVNYIGVVDGKLKDNSPGSAYMDI